MATKTYNSREVSLTLGAYSIDSGRAAGDFVTTKMSAELYKKSVGADGEVTRSKVNDRSATITIKLMQTSDGHAVLTGLAAAGRLSRNSEDIVPFQLRDRNGGLVESAESCWIEKEPDSSFGAEAGEREWTLATDNLVRVAVPR